MPLKVSTPFEVAAGEAEPVAEVPDIEADSLADDESPLACEKTPPPTADGSALVADFAASLYCWMV